MVEKGYNLARRTFIIAFWYYLLGNFLMNWKARCLKTIQNIMGGKRLKVTAKITKSFTDAGKLKAFATVCLADAFLVTGVRVVECEKGITVFMPSMKDKEDEYRDVCFPIKPELRSQINTAVLNAYDACLKENEPDGE